jgi:hypothetical protein
LKWISRHRSVLTAAATLASIAAVAGVIVGAAGAATTASTPSCSTKGLAIWFDTNGNGSAGSVAYQLEFTNLSGHTCTLQGYPGVSAVSVSGHQIGKAASRSKSPTKLITLKNGATASATLQITDAGNFPSSACGQTTAAGAGVFPPNQKLAKLAPFPFAACKKSGPNILTIRAITKQNIP